MRTTVTAEPPEPHPLPHPRNNGTGPSSVGFGDMPVLTDRPTQPEPPRPAEPLPAEPPPARATTLFGPGGPAHADAAFGREEPTRVP